MPNLGTYTGYILASGFEGISLEAGPFEREAVKKDVLWLFH